MSNIFTVNLPDIGEGVVEGEVVQWLKAVGDPLKQDEPVVVVMTDKATVELPAPHPGRLAKTYFQPGGVAILNKPLYDIEVDGIVTQSASTEVPAVKDSVVKKSTATANTAPACVGSRSDKTLATPATRHLARQLGIDINTVTGSGEEGRVLPCDLRPAAPKAAATKPWALPGDESAPLIGIRKLTAAKMVEAKANAPHFSYFDTAEATRLIQLRNNIMADAAKEGVNLSYMPFLIKALSLTMMKHPQINGSVDQATSSFIIHKVHNIGIAIDSPLGLIVPVLKGVESMSLKEVILTFESLKRRARESKLANTEMKEGTITISNFGTVGNGGLFATPILNYPEVAILGVARIKKMPVVKAETIVIQDCLNLSWTFDHRVIDGGLAAQVSATFSDFIAHPAKLL